ncbi:MAG: aminoglycoside 6'-N-acetyltransferase [Spirosomataceae bacterium]
MLLEPLSAQNLTAFTQLALELWPEGDFDEEYAYFQSLIDSENDLCSLVKEHDTYVAFLHVSLRTDYVEGADDAPVAYMEALYVQPACQNRGIGQRLVEAGAAWGRQKGCKQLASDTEWNNVASIAFHRKSGFSEANRIVCFIKAI